MADFKEINAEKFKENLVSNFGDNDKVNIFFEELVQKNTDKNPFFYSVILNHIEKNNLSITDLVDSKSQVHFEQINVAIVQAHKEYKEKIIARENSEKQKNQNQQINEEINKNNQEFEQRFKLIDFENLKDDDVFYILQNFTKASKRMTDIQYESVKSETKKVFNDKGMTEELTDKITDIMDILFEKNNDKNNKVVSKKVHREDNIEYLLQLGAEINEQGDLIVSDEIMQKVQLDFDNIIETCVFIDHSGIDVVKNMLASGERPEITETLIKLGINIEEFNNHKKIQEEIKKSQMQEENEQYINERMTVTRDYAEMGLEDSRTNVGAAEAFWGDEFGDEELEDIGQDVVELENKTQQVKPIEPEGKAQEFLDLDPINQEEVEQKVQKEIDNSDYQQEIDEKTGIAGLFAAIANSRVGRAVKNLFKTKDAQKRLNAPVTQRTEDGLKITEYESNGSLVPTTIQARNFLRDFAVNTVEAVTNFANNISNAMRGNKEEEVINKPTVIKSEPVQEQAGQVEQHVVEKNTDKKILSENAFDRYVKLNPEAQSNFDQNAAIIGKNAAQVATMSNKTQNQNTQNKDENEGIEF